MHNVYKFQKCKKKEKKKKNTNSLFIDSHIVLLHWAISIRVSDDDTGQCLEADISYPTPAC